MTKTILVTGAGRGIGRQLTRRLVRDGHRVTALVRDPATVPDPGCRTVTADLADPASLAAALPRFDSLDVLVHNAGVAALGTVEDLTVEQWHRHLTVNLAAPAELTRLLLPALRAARGLVLFVNSGAGLSAGAQWSAYGASKHGLKALADALRAEERGNGVRVATLYPGNVDTDMQRQLRAESGTPYDTARTLRPETVAQALVSMIDLPSDAVAQDVRLVPPDPAPLPAV